MSDFVSIVYHVKEAELADEADELEWKAIQLGTIPISGSENDNAVSGELMEPQSLDESNVERVSTDSASVRMSKEKVRKTNQRENLTTGIKKELARRQEILGEFYPFTIEANTVKYTKKYNSEAENSYEFLLKTAVAPTRKDRERFEFVVSKALINYLGKERAKGAVFGWQADPEKEQTTKIKAKFQKLFEDSGEWNWNPDTEQGFVDDPPVQIVKDCGLDVVVWLPSPDKRLGKIYLAAQCATGKTDWQDKLDDVSWTRLRNWIRTVPKEWTIRCFAIPFHMPNHAFLMQASGRGGMFFDRSRLTLLLKE